MVPYIFDEVRNAGQGNEKAPGNAFYERPSFTGGLVARPPPPGGLGAYYIEQVQMYCILRIHRESDEYKPNLPDGLRFCEVASQGVQSGDSFGLYQTDLIEEEVLQAHGGQRVPKELALLMRCARYYPPALALARKAVSGP